MVDLDFWLKSEQPLHNKNSSYTEITKGQQNTDIYNHNKLQKLEALISKQIRLTSTLITASVKITINNEAIGITALYLPPRFNINKQEFCIIFNKEEKEKKEVDFWLVVISMPNIHGGDLFFLILKVANYINTLQKTVWGSV